MFPRSDVRFLRTLHSSLRRVRPIAPLPGPKRAATALILHFAAPTPPLPHDLRRTLLPAASEGDGDAVSGVLEHLEAASADLAPCLQVLFLKRSTAEGDRWSGQVALPGGKRDAADDSDLAAAQREALEEVGLSLRHREGHTNADYAVGGPYVCLGQLPDYNVTSFGKRAAPLVLSRFVFLHLCPGAAPPPTTPCPREVFGVHWFALAGLAPSAVVWGVEKYRVVSFLPKALARVPVVGDVEVEFPSVGLTPTPWHLWGITLGTISNFLAFGGQPRLDWPGVRCSGPVSTWLLAWPFQGWRAVRADSRREPGRDGPVRQRAVAALVCLIAATFAVVVVLGYGTWCVAAAGLRAVRRPG